MAGCDKPIIVVDYGMGNLGSILNMVKKVGAAAELSKCPDDVMKADKLILPGVGAFDNAMIKLGKLGYVDALNQRVLGDGTPVLGICLGMQLFCKRSEEGQEPGLGWLDAETIRFRFDAGSEQRKIPHMGWDYARIRKPTSVFPDPEQERRFYFVHSYHVRCNDPGDVLASTRYGIDFTSAVSRGNILGTQFHPEKSHRFGLEFFRAFSTWLPDTAPGK